MTDKELTIDGVNVRECDLYFQNSYNEHCCECMNGYRPCSPKHWGCSAYVQYLEREFQRKTTECEYWKHQAELGCDTTDRLSKEIKQKEQECEQLIEENHYLTKFHDKVMSIYPFSYDCDYSSDENIKNYGCYLESIDKGFTLLVKDVFRLQDIAEVPKDIGLYPLGIAHKLNSYRHALNEIEKNVKCCIRQDICTLCDYADKCRDEFYYNDYDNNRFILDIISKVRDNNNETSEASS